MIQGVIFDMDGLMFDTERIWNICWEPALAKFGLPYKDGLSQAARGTTKAGSCDVLRRFYGEDCPAMGIVEELYRLGHFPEAPIRAYLEQWRDRFWLFHPERPFWQVPEAKIGTEYTASKLNGELSESSNKLRLFSFYAGEGKEGLTYAQAARWLLSVNGYDDTSAKPKGKGLPSVGAGWLGKLGHRATISLRP